MSTSLLRRLSLPFVTTIALGTIASAVHAEDKLLNELVQFNGTFIFLGAKVPGLHLRRGAERRDRLRWFR